jgi:hypothetical protein
MVRDGAAFRDAYREVAADRGLWTEAQHEAANAPAEGSDTQQVEDMLQFLHVRGGWL